jgi:hypothetical protein
MSLQKLSSGVLRILTPLGPRYLSPSFTQRIYLLWIFRNFSILPAKVLTRRQTRLIDAICAEHRFVAMLGQDWLVLGTLEQRPAITGELPPRRPTVSVSDGVAFGSNLQQRS